MMQGYNGTNGLNGINGTSGMRTSDLYALCPWETAGGAGYSQFVTMCVTISCLYL